MSTRSIATPPWRARSPTSCSATPWSAIAARSATREPVELVALLRQVAQRAEAGGVSPPIELDLRALDGPAMVEGDPITLREAFTNLLDNARHYAGDQYPVQIRVAASRGRAAGRRRRSGPRDTGCREGSRARAIRARQRRAGRRRQRARPRHRQGGGRCASGDAGPARPARRRADRALGLRADPLCARRPSSAPSWQLAVLAWAAVRPRQRRPRSIRRRCRRRRA